MVLTECTSDEDKYGCLASFDGLLMANNVTVKSSSACGSIVESTWAQLMDCTTTECVGNGMAASFEGSSLKAEGCTMTGNTKHGVHVVDGVVAELRGCSTSDNEEVGYRVGDGEITVINCSSEGDSSSYGVADEDHLVLEEVTVVGVCQSFVLP